MSGSRWIEQLTLPVRAAVSATLVLAIAQLGQLRYPLFALVAAVIVTDLSAARTRELGLQRLAGTALGGVVGALLSHVMPGGPGAVGLGILIAMILCQVCRIPQSARICGYVCGIILFDPGDHPWVYALSRSLETILGICGAMLVSFVPRLVKSKDPDP